MTFSLTPPTAAVDAGQPQATVATLPKLVIAFGDLKKKKTQQNRDLNGWYAGQKVPSLHQHHVIADYSPHQHLRNSV